MNRAVAGIAMLLTTVAVAGAAGGVTYKERKQAQADAAMKNAAAMSAAQKGGYGIVNTIKIGGDWLWQKIAFGPDGKFLYTSKGRKTAVLDAMTGKDVGDIAAGQGADGIAIAPDAGRGFITNRDGTITVFDTKTYRVLGAIHLGAEPGPIIYDSMSKHIFVDCQGKLVPIVPTMDLAKDKPEPGIDLPGKVSSMVADGQGMLYLAFTDHEAVGVIDTRIMQKVILFSINTLGRPEGISMDRLHSRLFVACRNGLVVMSASDGHVVDHVNIGQTAIGTAFSDGKVFVCGQEGVVSVIGQNTEGKFAVEQSILVGGALRAPKVNPKTGEIYVPQVDLNGHRGINGTFKLIVLGKK